MTGITIFVAIHIDRPRCVLVLPQRDGALTLPARRWSDGPFDMTARALLADLGVLPRVQETHFQISATYGEPSHVAFLWVAHARAPVPIERFQTVDPIDIAPDPRLDPLSAYLVRASLGLSATAYCDLGLTVTTPPVLPTARLAAD
jgi:hypothetical protein